MMLLPYKGPYSLSMDRTNWQFGHTDINELVVGITYEGVAFLILFRWLPKRGNSNTQERIDSIDRFIKLFGKSCIESLVSDREFVGEKWLEYLNQEGIPYHLRIRENFWVKDPRTGKEFKAFWIFNRLRLGCIIGLYTLVSRQQQNMIILTAYAVFTTNYFSIINIGTKI